MTVLRVAALVIDNNPQASHAVIKAAWKQELSHQTRPDAIGGDPSVPQNEPALYIPFSAKSEPRLRSLTRIF